jgi:hypothetical protein
VGGSRRGHENGRDGKTKTAVRWYGWNSIGAEFGPWGGWWWVCRSNAAARYTRRWGDWGNARLRLSASWCPHGWDTGTWSRRAAKWRYGIPKSIPTSTPTRPYVYTPVRTTSASSTPTSPATPPPPTPRRPPRSSDGCLPGIPHVALTLYSFTRSRPRTHRTSSRKAQ